MDPDIQRTPLLEGENRGVLLGKAHLSHFSPPPGPLYAHTSRKFSLSFPKARGSIYIVGENYVMSKIKHAADFYSTS